MIFILRSKSTTSIPQSNLFGTIFLRLYRCELHTRMSPRFATYQMDGVKIYYNKKQITWDMGMMRNLQINTLVEIPQSVFQNHAIAT